MVLMFLVYLVQMIGPLGWAMMIGGALVVIIEIIVYMNHEVSRSLETGHHVLSKPALGFEAGTSCGVDMYSSYGYVRDSSGDKLKLSRGELTDLFKPKTYELSIPKFAYVVFLMGFLLPNKDTTIYMAGAYMVQEVVTSDTAKEIGNLAVDATKAQLKAWAAESPELAALLVQSGINEAKAAVKQEVVDKL